MTHSQINHAKAWGFSRRSLNLNHFGQGHERFNVTSANTSNPHERSQLSSKSVITWLKNLHYEHLECNKERVKSIKEKYGIDQDYTHGQKGLGDFQ